MSQAELVKDEVVKAAFGAKNRARLLDSYFSSQARSRVVAPWEHFYRLLLWVDQTTGLAHCYESDKSQPGKNWYGRSLAFHDWVSRSLCVAPGELAGQVDWLFRHAMTELAAAVLRSAQRFAEAAERQLHPYSDLGMPQPGEDPELVAIIREILGENLRGDVPAAKWHVLVQRIRQYLALENKRKNLVGEGFEDVIVQVAQRALSDHAIEFRARPPLHEVRGFNPPGQGEKINKVDVAITRPKGGLRTLVTAKWSIRADRERQFASDYADYVRAESERRPFEYVFITNEFDPARLMRACDQLAGNSYMFTHVVHINPSALQATYGPSSVEESMRKVLSHIQTGRLIGFDRWIEILRSIK